MILVELLLKDRGGRWLGTIFADCAEEGIHRGQFVPNDWPAELQDLFAQYETLVNDQAFSALDELEEEIGAHGFCVSYVGSDRCESIEDLQITKDRRVSFRLAT